MVVSVYDYPNAIKPDDRHLASVEKDLENLTKFLAEQKFDEVIVLKNAAATPEHITEALREYVYPLVHGVYKGRSRFLFAYDGHGAYADDPALAGALALTKSAGENDTDPADSYSLRDLASRLEEISAFAYQSVALLGSCYSGSVFPTTVIGSPYFSNSLAPGAHVVAAASRTSRAWTGPEGKGTIFFDDMIAAVRDAKPSGVEVDIQSISDAEGHSYPRGGVIVRLPRAVLDVNEALEDVFNPETHERYPQLVMGQMAPGKGYEGAFFFLGSASTTEQVATAGAAVDTETEAEGVEPPSVSSEAQETGSAVVGRPDLKIFNPPEYYKIRGLDLAQFNSEINFDAIDRSEVKFIYARATQGAAKRDKRYRRYDSESSRVGLGRGAYHVFSFCDDPDEQFANLSTVVQVSGDLLPIGIDVEWFDGPRIPGEEKCGNIEAVQQKLLRLAQRIEGKYGKTPILYVPATALGTLLDDRFQKYPVWIARWRDASGSFGPSVKGNNPWTLWQYDSRAHVAGVRGDVDLNVFFGTQDQFDAFEHGEGNIALTAAGGNN